MAKKELQNHIHQTDGKWMPLANFNKGGAKEYFVTICQYDVLEKRPTTVEDAAHLNPKGQIYTFY